MLKKSIAAAIGAMLVAGSASAVEWSPGGKGDLLIAPMVMTGGGWTSELKVVNHSATDSSVAKIVFHNSTDSAEVLDVFIFLSPGDVWTGSLVRNADGSVGLSSADESAITFQTRSSSAPFCPIGGTNVSGFKPTEARFQIAAPFAYVNIFQTRVIRGLGAAPVAKVDIFNEYRRLCEAQGTNPIGPDDTQNVLSGTVTLANPLNGNKLTLPMTALSSYNNGAYHVPILYTGFSSQNAPFTATKAQVEDALWANNYAVPFNNGAGNATFATVTFPTKEAFRAPSASGSQYSAFPGTVPISYTVRNQEEVALTTAPPTCTFSPCSVPRANNLVLPDELNIIAIAPNGSYAASTASQVNTQTFTSGWVNLNIFAEGGDVVPPHGNRLSNSGLLGSPALVTYINWDFSGSSLQGTWQYAPKSYASVGE